jgi:hypothetical protein
MYVWCPTISEEDHMIIALPILAKFLGACMGDYPSYSQKIICALLTKFGAITITGIVAQKRNCNLFYCEKFGMKVGKKNIKATSEQSRISKFLILKRDLFLDAVDASFKITSENTRSYGSRNYSSSKSGIPLPISRT